jgi:hypothetical protein
VSENDVGGGEGRQLEKEELHIALMYLERVNRSSNASELNSETLARDESFSIRRKMRDC